MRSPIFASSFFQQGKYDQAELLLKRSLVIEEKQIMLGYGRTVPTMHSLAILFSNQVRCIVLPVICRGWGSKETCYALRTHTTYQYTAYYTSHGENNTDRCQNVRTAHLDLEIVTPFYNCLRSGFRREIARTVSEASAVPTKLERTQIASANHLDVENGI